MAHGQPSTNQPINFDAFGPAGLAGLLTAALAGPAAGFGAFGAVADFFNTSAASGRQEERLATGRHELFDLADSVEDTSQFLGQEFEDTGFNLDFGAGSRGFSDFVAGDPIRDAGFDVSQFDIQNTPSFRDALNQATNLRGSQLAPGQLFSQVDFPETDFDAIGRARISGLGEQSRIRGEQSREQALGRGLASGRSLEELSGGELANIDIGEGRARALGASQIESDVTLLQQSEDLARARSQGELASVEAQINASLERAAAESSLQAAGLRGRNLGDLLRGQAASSGLGLQSDVSRAQLQQVSAGLLHQANQLDAKVRRRACQYRHRRGPCSCPWRLSD